MITLYKWGRKALVAQVITYNGEHFLPNSALRMLVTMVTGGTTDHLLTHSLHPRVLHIYCTSCLIVLQLFILITPKDHNWCQ